MNPTEPTLRSRVSSGGHSLWSPGDSVHLAWEAYHDLAAAIVKMVESGDTEDSLSCSFEGPKENIRILSSPCCAHLTPSEAAVALCPQLPAGYVEWLRVAGVVSANVLGEADMDPHHSVDVPDVGTQEADGVAETARRVLAVLDAVAFDELEEEAFHVFFFNCPQLANFQRGTDFLKFFRTKGAFFY